MKKILLPLVVVALCLTAYLYVSFEVIQFDAENDDVQAYSKKNMLEGLDNPKKKNLYYAVRHHKPRNSTLGFSITPPPGSNWYEKLENDSLFYLKLNKSHRQYSILTEAREVHLNQDLHNAEELQEYVRKKKERAIDSADFENPHVAVHNESSSSKICVRYSQSYQDYGLKGLRKGQYVNVVIQGLFCLHPDNSRIGVDVNYLEKSRPNTDAKSFSKEGEQFLSSLTFQEIMRR